MDFLAHFWTTVLYQPLFNLLIQFYNTNAHENLGVAVIYLTITLRVILLPLTIISEKNRSKYAELQAKIAVVSRDFKNDSVARKFHIRELLKKYRYSPWAKIAVLGVQLLALVVLYQVFIRGISASKLNLLYPWVDRPEIIYATFWGFNIGARNVGWAALVALVLFFDIYLDLRHKKVGKNDVLYLLVFPAGVFAVLWSLPMVKSLFILTSLFFSYIITAFRWVFFRPKKAHH